VATKPKTSTIKAPLKTRLITDGQWPEYLRLREHLKRNGVAEDIAWLVAAYRHPPRDGAAPEILGDPRYAEVAANWNAGRYPQPGDTSEGDGSPTDATNVGKARGPAPPDRKAEWKRLAAEVGDRQAPELDQVRWVAEHYLTDVAQISPDDVPCKAALGMLSWVQESSSNYGEFLRSNTSKLLPDKKTLEHDSRFADDGRDLHLIDEFVTQLNREERANSDKCSQCCRPWEDNSVAAPTTEAA
jgi:hypothetical protein